MDMPPSRYKVVEEGRRLVVVDRLTGERVKHQIHEKPHRPDMPAMEAPRREMRAPAPRPSAGGPARSFTTESWYDDKAPRTLLLDDDKLGALMLVGGVAVCVALVAFFFLGFVALFALGFILLQKGTRTSVRRGVTGWLDSLPAA